MGFRVLTEVLAQVLYILTTEETIKIFFAYEGKSLKFLNEKSTLILRKIHKK